jgi:site-specific recombinase XerD
VNAETNDRPDLSRRLVLAGYPRKLPAALSVEEVGRPLEAAPGIKYKAILGTAYGAGLRVSEVARMPLTTVLNCTAGWLNVAAASSFPTAKPKAAQTDTGTKGLTIASLR